jgi:hypothetical protein
VFTLGDLRGQANVWIGLKFESDEVNTAAEGGYVDNIRLRKATSGTCTAQSEVVTSDQQLIEQPSHVTLSP